METSKIEDAREVKADPYDHYDLQECLYSRKYAFQDIWPDKSRYVRYDSYSHAPLFNGTENLPAFVHFLRSHGHKSVWKVFKFFGLNDLYYQEIAPSTKAAVIDQLFRTIELYLSSTSRETIAAVYRRASQERLDTKNFLSGMSLSFSANPWEIATMSMRGITSCMSWHNTHSSSLAGSILDPYCGVISLGTDEVRRGTTTTFGRSMIARSVVRYVTCEGAHKILLERVYMADKGTPAGKQSLILKIFKDYIADTSGLEVLEPRQVNPKVLIPYFSHIPSLSDGMLSYRDSGVNYAIKDVLNERAK